MQPDPLFGSATPGPAAASLEVEHDVLTLVGLAGLPDAGPRARGADQAPAPLSPSAALGIW